MLFFLNTYVKTQKPQRYNQSQTYIVSYIAIDIQEQFESRTNKLLYKTVIQFLHRLTVRYTCAAH